MPPASTLSAVKVAGLFILRFLLRGAAVFVSRIRRGYSDMYVSDRKGRHYGRSLVTCSPVTEI